MKKIFLFLFLFLFFSCKSSKDRVAPPKYASGIENIKHNLEKGKIDLFEAYIKIKEYMRKHNDNSEEYSSSVVFVNEIVDLMNKRAKEEDVENNYEDTLRYLLSLKSIKKETNISLKSLYIKLSKKLDASADIFTRNDLKEEMADQLLLSKKDVYAYLMKFSKSNSRGVFLHAFDKYTKLYPALLKKYPELNNERQKMLKLHNLKLENLMKSVVAVILNKGMDIQNGMGYLDKTIGTGFFIDNDGFILTNHHVIAEHVDPTYEGYSMVYVTTRNDPDVEIPAKVVGFDKVFDIALLKVPVKNKDCLVIGRSIDMSVGDKIYTIGNPIGIKYTVTSGIISNKEIDFFQIGNAFQIDAAINPGNSGGPLIDERGQVVGIVFAGIPQFDGINFVIPFQRVRKTIPVLYKGGEVKRCWIGTGIYEDKNDKVYFFYILPNGPAHKAGIKEGDRLIKIEGFEVNTVEDAQDLLAWKRYPRLIEIKLERNGKVISKILRLEKRPYLPVETLFEKDTESRLIKLIFGIELEYYKKGFLFKKYKTIKIYKGMYGSKLGISKGEPIVVYDLKYLKKQKIVKLTIKFKQGDVGVLDRVITVVSPVEINSIL